MAAYSIFDLKKKKLPEIRCNLPQTACGLLNLFARHNFSKPRVDFVDTPYIIVDGNGEQTDSVAVKQTDIPCTVLYISYFVENQLS
jgi:hypothetical protein